MKGVSVVHRSRKSEDEIAIWAGKSSGSGS